MDRFWLFTWTTYGTWLPGDVRGFVSNVRDGPGRERRHNKVGTPYDADIPGLRKAALKNMRGGPIFLTSSQAVMVFRQIQETGHIRGWHLSAVAIIPNHVHVVLGVSGDPDPGGILRDLKSYASRALNNWWTKPPCGTWWTESGSKRKLKDSKSIIGAVRYVRQQRGALLIWTRDDGLILGERPA